MIDRRINSGIYIDPTDDTWIDRILLWAWGRWPYYGRHLRRRVEDRRWLRAIKNHAMTTKTMDDIAFSMNPHGLPSRHPLLEDVTAQHRARTEGGE